MTAAYESTIFGDLPQEALSNIIRETAKAVADYDRRIRIEHEGPERAVLRVCFNLSSWGERITLTLEQRSIRIVSKSTLPGQIIDWGKNRRNVERIRAVIRHKINDAVSTDSA